MKRKLLLAAFAAMVGLCAQAWDGNAGKVYLQNVGSGFWWGAGNSWGTQASLLVHPEYVTFVADGNNFKLESQVSNGGTAYYFEGDYMDNGSPVSLTVTQVGDYYTIANGTTYYGYDGSSTVLGKGVDANTDNGKWRIFTEAEMLANLENATEENPVDATFLILDPNFGRNNRNVGAWTMVASNQNLSGGNNTNNCAESFHATFTLSQAIANAPYGYYGLKGQAFYRQDGSDNTNLPYFYFNNEKVNFPLKTGSENSMSDASESFTNGLYKTDELRVTHAGGSLTIGAKLENNTSLWCIWDNFELMYYGPIDLTEFKNQLAEKVAEAEAVEGTIPSAVYANISSAITANNKVYATADEYAAAIKAIDDAIIANTPADIIAAFSRYTTIRDAVVTISNSSIVTAADTEANAATTADAIETAVGSVRNALAAYLPTVELGDGEFIDLTAALLDNPAPGISGKTDYWTNSEAPGFGYQLWEYYKKSGATTKQTIATSLPAGTYRLTAVAYTRTGYEAKLSAGTASTNIATVASGTVNNLNQGNSWIAAGNGTTDLMFTLAEATSNLEIGLTAATTGDQWMCWRSFQLVYGNVFPAYTLATGKMNAEIESAQTAAETAFTANKSVDTYNALTTAITAAQNSITAYGVAKTAIDKANAIKDAHNFASAAAITTFAEAIAAISDKYDDGTLEDAAASAAGTTLGTVVTGWHGGNNNAAPVYLRDGFALGDFAADPALHVNTWSTEGDGDGTGFSVPFYETWTGSASLPEETVAGTLSGLPNGLYSVTVWVRKSAASDAEGITMDVNGGSAVAIVGGDKVGNFYLKEYTAEGFVKRGTLTLTFNVAGETGISWLSFKNVKYTKLRDLTEEEAFIEATAEDYAALNAAIDAHVLGFEAGEYAPYNNIEAAAALATAKAIDQTARNSQDNVQAATAAVTGATWTANDAEVNAIWDGSFEHDYSGQSGNVQPIGWYRNEGTYTGDGYNVRYVTVPSGVEGNTSGHGLFGKFTMQYGKESGYTLPLKEGYYKLSFSYGGYGEQGERIVKLIGDSEMTIATVKAKNNQANTKADAYTAFSQVIKVPAAGNYVLSFYRQNTTSQNQIAVVDIKLFRATAEDLKPLLAEEITTAGKIDTEHNVGTAAFQIPAAAVTALTSEITAAQAVYDDAEATADEVSDAIADLQAAEAIELNTPDPAQAYHLVFNCDGHTATGNALTLIPNPSQTQGLYGLKYLAPANVNLAQAFYFVHTTGNKYKVYAVDTDGNDRYITTQAEGYGTTWYEGIRTITDASKAMEIEIRPNGEGLYLLWNTGANKALAHNGTNNNDLFTNNTANFQFVATTKPSIDINTTALGWATTMLPFAVAELPEGVKAYTCAAVNGTTLVLNEVTELEANKPYIIEGEWVETLTGDAQGQELTYTEGLLTGTYAEIDAINGTYILQKQDEKVAFYHVNTDVAQPKVPANRCYLTYSADPGVKMFILEDMATGVNLVPGEGVTVNGSEIYNLAGQKLSKTQKGVNIIGGKKVIIK